MTTDEIEKTKELNTAKIRQDFFDYVKKVKYKGIFGVAKFSSVYNDLMPIQQDPLKNSVKEQFYKFMDTGSIISIGIFYPPDIIDCINVEKNGKTDKDLWNDYSDEYERINNMLKDIGKEIADKFNGFAFPPTTGVPEEKISEVTDYFQHTISHRVVAEHAGIGWRGKSELIITKTLGPAIRLTSVLINIPLIQNKVIESLCGECEACLDVCSILKNKEQLENYRENCNKFLYSLGLKHHLCGKCIKACIRDSIFKDQFI